MKRFDFPHAEEYVKKNRNNRIGKWMLAAASVVVVCITAHKLILPAVTMEQEVICGKEEHTHSEACYQMITPEGLLCTQTYPGGEHQHTESCYDETGALICGVAEHIHNETCYPQPIRTLVCGKEEHTHTESCYAKNVLNRADTPGEQTEGNKQEEPGAEEKADGQEDTTGQAAEEGIHLDNNYIKGAKLFYRPKDSTDTTAWIEIKSDTTNIPGDATFRLQVSYKDVPITRLKENNRKLYYDLPEILKNPVASGDILESGGGKVGVLEANKQRVTLTFEENWLDKQHETSGPDTVAGDFYVTAEMDLSKVPETGPGKLQIGNVNIDIHFQDNVHAATSTVEIEKARTSVNVIEELEGDFLEYTLTVRVPTGALPAPDVSVEDKFTAGANWIDSYVLPPLEIPENTTVDVSGKSENPPGVLKWTIGTMQPGESKMLKYRVKLKDGYTGKKAENKTLNNLAEVYSKTYKRDEAVANFTPRAGMTMNKKSSQYVSDGKGRGTITYTIWAKANEDNSYTLDNVKIKDGFKLDPNKKTKPEILEHLNFVEGSFHLYKGGTSTQNGAEGLEEITDAAGLNPNVGETNPQMIDDIKGFQYYIGDLKPGESKTLVYTVTVSEKIFALGNEPVETINRAILSPNDANGNEENYKFTAGTNIYTVGKKVWNRKMVGAELEEDETVSIPQGDSVYDSPGTPSDNSPGNFTVPKGSYQYRVVVNEKGDWNVSSALLKDTMGEYLRFSGYMQIAAYEPDSTFDTALTNEEAAKALEDKTPVKTVWLKVDGSQKFEFHPNEFGLTENYAYLLTYYAKPVDMGNNSTTVVNNGFVISGPVIGPGGTEVNLKGIEVSTSVTVQGSSRYVAEKQSWYYEPPKGNTEGTWSKGAIYWAIKVTGNGIPEGTQFKDKLLTNNHKINTDSVVGVYKGILPKNVTDYASIEALENENGLTPLAGNSISGETVEGTDYQWVKGRENNLDTAVITFQKTIPLDEGESVYIIIKTEPTQLPPDGRNDITCKNQLDSSGDGGKTWVNQSDAQKILHGSNGCFKEVKGPYTYDGTTWSSSKDLEINLINKPGAYIDWRVHINYDGSMSGLVQITDKLPKGVQPVYVKQFWQGSDYSTLSKPSMVTIDKLENDSEWEKLSKYPAYYNSKTGELRWDVSGVVPGGSVKDSRAVEFQVVCRVTDEILLNGQENTLINQFEAEDERGVKGNGTKDIIVQRNTLSKKGTYNADKDGRIYPFEIKVNEIGEDLLSGSERITVVDELSSTLTLDVSSIKVINTKTKEDITDSVLTSVEQTTNGQILRLEVPDNLPLTITYNTTVNAAPGQAVNISNRAHWQGYESPNGGSVSKENFKYEAGGTVETDAKPGLLLTKYDQADTKNLLAGAVFELVEGTFKDNGFVESTETGRTVSDIQKTDGEGKATFEKDDSGYYWMDFNTVYRLTETKAPAGYVLDDTPYYFAIAKEVELGEGGEKQYPPVLKEWEQQGVHIHYGSAEYAYQAYNHKGEAAVEKKFQKADGSSVDTGQEPDGSFRFALYETEQTKESTGNPLQTITITYLNGKPTYYRDSVKIDKPNFINLELDRTYYIYELDDTNQPILDGTMAVADGRTFTVTYGSTEESVNSVNSVTPTEKNQTEGNLPKVNVTNREKTFQLPATGGIGTHWYIGGGLLLLAAALLLFYKKIKMERGEQS